MKMILILSGGNELISEDNGLKSVTFNFDVPMFGYASVSLLFETEHGNTNFMLQKLFTYGPKGLQVFL
jgi:hypothetical protein